MKVIRFLVLCLAVLSLFGCMHSVGTPTSPEQMNLDKNSMLWEKINVPSYTYTYRRVCYCPPEEDVVVTVTNGQVSAASYSPSDTPLNPERLAELMTVKDLFQVIQKAISDQVARLNVTYNSELGYPETIYIDVDERMADEEITHIVSDLH